MFGQQDDQTQTMQNNTGMMPQDVPADGTLGAPMTDSSSLPMMAPDSTMTAPAMSSDDSMPAYEPTGSGDTSSTSSRDMHAQTPEELISIKQEALQSLKPLVSHLDESQSAEERFRTRMMMIQASDDQSLIPEAYEAAKAIEDDKVRAQALLDVVNEINYFTAQHAQN